ncbi:hypothetical protein [Tsukamurella spumae]|uniref:DUF3551 domain-containing protein n=1 Tax=Tsukamurella spumae TaxID=44753 RepID=A0A846X4F5_9ACTN|nr:hypothetical protein [Tsukamurella spumae]NKY19445.1 hypothetical protein [Tsukamurella spumae]
MNTKTFHRRTPRRIVLGASIALALAPLVAAPAAQADTNSCSSAGMIAQCGPYASQAQCEASRAAMGGIFLWPTAPGYEPARVRLLPCEPAKAGGWETIGSLAG